MPRTSNVAGATKKNGAAAATAAASLAQNRSPNLNGSEALDLQELLHALQAMRVGDFSVRMAGHRVGIMGKVADTFNEIVAANQRMAKQLERVGQVVGREGKTRQRVRFGLSEGAWGEMESSVNSLIDDLLWPTTEVTRAIAAVAQGDLLRTVALDVDGRPLKGEFLRSAEIVNTMIKQLNVFTSEVTRVAREVGTEGKLGGQAQVARSDRRVEGPHRERQFDGLEPDRAGSQHRRGDDRGRQRRLVEKDHRRRARRDPAAQGSHQHDGRSAALVRVGSHARRPRGRHRRQARRSGDRARRRRHLEGFDQLGQRHVRQPHRPGAQHRACDHGRGARRPVAQDHGRRARRNSRTERHHQHDGGPAQRVCLGSDPRRARGRHRRQARRSGASAGRRRHLEGPDRQRQLHGAATSRRRSATSPTSRPPSPAATCRRRSP